MSGDGGPAFPVTPAANQPYTEGMPLRDWFAGMALQGFLSDDKFTGYKEAATSAYLYADAMLSELDKSKETMTDNDLNYK